MPWLFCGLFIFMSGMLFGSSAAGHFMNSRIRHVASRQRELNEQWKLLNERWEVIQVAEERNRIHYQICNVPWRLDNGMPLIVEGEFVD